MLDNRFNQASVRANTKPLGINLEHKQSTRSSQKSEYRDHEQTDNIHMWSKTLYRCMVRTSDGCMRICIF